MKFIEERKIPLSIAMFLVFFLINHNVNEKSSIFSKKKSWLEIEMNLGSKWIFI